MSQRDKVRRGGSTGTVGGAGASERDDDSSSQEGAGGAVGLVSSAPACEAIVGMARGLTAEKGFGRTARPGGSRRI